MMWDEVMARVKTVILEDPTLLSLFGEAYRKAGVSELRVPVIEWNLLSDTENELWAPMLVQFDIWTDVAANARHAERRLRSLFHKDLLLQIDDLQLFAEYTDGTDLATPNRADFTGRGLRFRFTPLRRQYALPGVIPNDPPLPILDGGPP